MSNNKRYFRPGWEVVNEKFKQSQREFPPLEECLLIAFATDKGVTIRHQASVPPKMLQEIGERIIELAKRLQQ